MSEQITEKEYPYEFSVIMPVYNVAQFLEEALDSIVQQTIGFENIQMILVDDGSTDNSGVICDAFQERYPDQTIVIHKENGGQASARNMALPYIQGKYVSMPDPDDILGKDALQKAESFLDRHNDVDMCCIPLQFFGTISGAHPLNYRFKKGTQVVDLSLDENMDCINLSVASSFFRAVVAKSMHFDTELFQAEDAKAVLDLLMNNPYLGLVANAKYYYRKHGNSTLDKSKFEKRSYTRHIELFSKWALDTAEERFGYIPRFVQYTVMYDLQWKLREAHIQPGVLSVEEEQEYRNNLVSIAKRIDDEVILKQKNLGLAYKTFLLSKKYDSKLELSQARTANMIDDMVLCDQVLRYKGRRFVNISQMSSGWEFVSIDSSTNNIVLDGYHVFYGGFTREDVIPYVIVNGHALQCELTSRRNVEYSLDVEVAWRIGFRAVIPITETSFSFYPAVMLNHKLIPRRNISFGCFFPLNSDYKKMRAYINGWMLYFNSGELKLDPSPGVISRIKNELLLDKELWTKNKLGGRKAIFARALYHLGHTFKHRKLWIISDRIMKADDNGEALFRYLIKNKPHNTRIVYAISKNSTDAKRMAQVGPCVDAMSWHHKYLHLLCDANISSQADGVTVNPFYGHSGALQDLLARPLFIFLQHGVIQDDLSAWLNRYNKNIAGFVTSAVSERNSILSDDYGYSAESIWLTGLPRFDRLYHKEEKVITVMPTWRQYLMTSIDSETSVWKPADNIQNSQYYRFYSQLLSSTKLMDTLDKYGYILQFFPHPNLRLAKVDFAHDSRVKVLPLDVTYREIYAVSSLVLTDYSSAAFDFAYLRKPLIYCQFDKDEFFSGTHTCTEGYFEYERDGFGEVEYDVESTIERIIEYVKSDCALKPLYRERIDNFFAFNDCENCKRVTEKILDLLKSNN